jgi:diguanylate cyclase (GGDEF)-like protein
VPVVVVVLAAAVAGGLRGGFTDLFVYRYAGQNVLDGLPVYGVRDPVMDLRFTYPPFGAVVVVPLGLVPQWVADAAWTAASVAALAGTVLVARRALGRPTPGWLVAAVVLAALAMEPAWQTLTFGQVNAVLVLAVLVDVVRPETRWAGVLTGVAAGIKLEPLVFVVLLVLVGHRAAAARAAVAFATTVGIGFLVMPGAAATFWSDRLLDASRVGPPGLAHNQSVYGALTRLLGGEPSPWLWLGLAAPLAITATLVAAGWYGWWLAALTVPALAIIAVLERAYHVSGRPERVAAVSIAAVEAIIAAGVAGTGGARSPLLGFLAVPVVMLATRFRPRVVAAGLAASLVMLAAAVGVAVVLPPAPAAPALVPVVAYLGLLVGLVAAAVTLLGAELQSRGEATVDPLTGLFNRKTLRGRFAEAAEQARVLDSSVAVIICDIDHFKQVNDEHGHDRGDAVLRQVAQQMRRTLRSSDLVYRLGGEEFLVLLPGQDPAGAAAVANRVVADLAAETLDGLHITVSAGVASAHGTEVDYDRLLRDADRALYHAKRAGRNRVYCAALSSVEDLAS